MATSRSATPWWSRRKPPDQIRRSFVAWLAVALVLACLPLSAAAESNPGPTVTVVDASTLQVTDSTSGYCWTGSLVSRSADAWRCGLDTNLANGANLLDPCFADGPQATSVVCATSRPNSPDWPSALQVTLDAPLGCQANGGMCGSGNKGGPPSPWLLQLDDGTTCGFVTGATWGVGGERANFGCDDQSWIVGQPFEMADGTWLALRATVSQTDRGPQAGSLQLSSVTAVWEV